MLQTGLSRSKGGAMGGSREGAWPPGRGVDVNVSVLHSSIVCCCLRHSCRDPRSLQPRASPLPPRTGEDTTPGDAESLAGAWQPRRKKPWLGGCLAGAGHAVGWNWASQVSTLSAPNFGVHPHGWLCKDETTLDEVYLFFYHLKISLWLWWVFFACYFHILWKMLMIF